MEERRWQRQGRRIDRLGRWRAVLAHDVNLAARLGGTVASLLAAGGAALVALSMLLDADVAVPLGWLALGSGLLLCPLLVGILLVRRRVQAEQAVARLRARVAVVLIALGVFVGGMLGAARTPLGDGLFATIAALFVAVAGFWAYGFVASAISRMARARRQDWYAQLRAARLTRRMLGYSAYRQLRRDGALPVQSVLHPRRTYLVPIRTTPSGARILVLEGERPLGGLCLRPRQPLPDPEEALAHIMAIRTDERAWLERANFFPQDCALSPQALGLAPGRPGNYER